MKRKWTAALAVLLAALALCPAALAAGKTYALDALDAEITVLEGDFYILTQDMDAEDPTLSAVGMTPEQVNGLLKPSNILMDVLYYDSSYEFAIQLVIVEEHEKIFNYKLLSQLQRDTAVAQGRRELERQGYTVGDLFWYDGEEASYLVTEFWLPEDGGWAYQYQTVYNGKGIAVTASSLYLDEITDEIKDQAKALADGIHFTHTDPVPEEVTAFLAGTEEPEGSEGSFLLEVVRNSAIGAVLAVIVVIAASCLMARRKKQKADAAAAAMEDREGKEDEHGQ